MPKAEIVEGKCSICGQLCPQMAERANTPTTVDGKRLIYDPVPGPKGGVGHYPSARCAGCRHRRKSRDARIEAQLKVR